MDKIQSMTTFVAVVKAGSFIRAIESTGLSRAAVSRQVMETGTIPWRSITASHNA
ncbi:Uncharacterised protein [Raoultella terrigena]|uniref:HTH lysR-type domain-containing protein n=1 Tax=Raoultella terrigena TaxID=577 RepID=A0A3P8KNL0_RAOTE|nr:Uncharacterised protein [Raoultella terrigena]